MLLGRAPPSSAAAQPRRRASLPPPSLRCSRRGQTSTTTVVDYGDDDDFRHYVARVEFPRAGASSPLSAIRIEVRGAAASSSPPPSVLLTAAPTRSPRTAYLAHAETASASNLVLEDDGAWPMERSSRRAFALSAGGGAGDEGAFFFVGFSAAAASPALHLRAAARGLEVAVSSAPGWSPANSADFSWDAAARMAAARARAAAAESESSSSAGDDNDPAARATQSLVLRPPTSGNGAGWRSFAAGVPVVVDVKLPGMKNAWRGLRGTMALERRREWGGGGGRRAKEHPVAAAARRRRAMMRALAAPPWLESPWGSL